MCLDILWTSKKSYNFPEQPAHQSPHRADFNGEPPVPGDIPWDLKSHLLVFFGKSGIFSHNLNGVTDRERTNVTNGTLKFKPFGAPQEF